MASKLELIFATDQHGKFKLTLHDPRPDLTEAEVSAMNTIIENVFLPVPAILKSEAPGGEHETVDIIP